MSQAKLRREIRDARLFETLRPPAVMRQEQAVGQVIDPTGALLADAVRPYIQPLRYRFWVPGALSVGRAGGRDLVPRAGQLVRLAAHAGTAPTGTRCVVRLVDTGGAELAVVTLRPGQTSAESGELRDVDLLAGQWLGLEILQTGTAADLSVVAVQQMGQT